MRSIVGNNWDNHRRSFAQKHSSPNHHSRSDMGQAEVVIRRETREIEAHNAKIKRVVH